MEIKFELKTVEDRKKAFTVISERILRDILNGRIPTYHVLHFNRDGSAHNHFMTPISLEPVDSQGRKMIWIQDFEFWLKFLLKNRKVTYVEYVPSRPAILFTYDESA